MADIIERNHVLTPEERRAIEAAAEDRPPVWLMVPFFGLFIGGALSGRVFGRSRFETLRGPHTPVRVRWLFAFLGGAIMGHGARMARGRPRGQALSGGAVLSGGRWGAMFGVFPGG